MFNENDKWLNIVYKIILIIVITQAVLVFIIGIVLAILIAPIYILISFLDPIGCLIFWCLFRLFISLLVDVKLIRNKLYNSDNSNLKKYINTNYQDAKEKQNNNTKNCSSINVIGEDDVLEEMIDEEMI